MRNGASWIVAVVLAALAAAPAFADVGATTTATTTTATTSTTTTAPVTTAATTTVATTTTATATATAASTTTAAATTTALRPPQPRAARAPRKTAAKLVYAVVQPTALRRRCRAAGAVAILEPHGAPVALGAVPGTLGPSAYPQGGALVAFAGLDATGATCRPGALTIRGLSLLGDAVRAESVTSLGGRGTASGLRVDGQPVQLAPGEVVAVGSWGRLAASASVGRRFRAALALTLLAPRAGLPAGTVVLVGFGTRALPRKQKHLPLKVTPPLGETGYVFPVGGKEEFGDTYGGPRPDVASGWHHGDDIFAAIGTPVVAVADGTLELVGWDSLGGWRVWLVDAKGNQFYYAHLAGYARPVLRDRTVRAGEVIGFVGRTGDAFGTPSHLHFEIHPRGLLSLGYDGAVDPTSYLLGWRHETPRHVPLPARPRLAPQGLPRVESAVVWRQLLVARHLLPTKTVARSLLRSSVRSNGASRPVAAASVVAAPPSAPRTSAAPRGASSLAWLAIVLGLSAVAGLAAARDGFAGGTRLARSGWARLRLVVARLRA